MKRTTISTQRISSSPNNRNKNNNRSPNIKRNNVDMNKLKELESNWNDNVHRSVPVKKLKKLLQPKLNIVTDGLPRINNPEIIKFQESENDTASSSQFTAYDSISSVLGFQHHEDTNRMQEMKVVKTIIIRENILASLHTLVEQFQINSRKGTKKVLKIIETMTKLRDSTAQYIDALVSWRLTATSFDPWKPKPFFWKDENYTLKLINDLDFIADNILLVEKLGLNVNKIKNNPLMLAQGVYELDDASDPFVRASMDTKGICTGSVYEERLKLRRAERVILQEIQSQQPRVLGSVFDNSDDSAIIENDNVSMISMTNEVGKSIAHNDSINLENWKVLAKMQLESLENKKSYDVRIVNENIREVSYQRQLNHMVISTIMKSPKKSPANSPKKSGNYLSPTTASLVRSVSSLASSVESNENQRSITTSIEDTNENEELRPKTATTPTKPPKAPMIKSPSIGLFPKASSIASNSDDDKSISSFKTMKCISSMMTGEDIDCLLAINRPFKELHLAGACVVILLSNGPDIPEDIAWTSFKYTLMQSEEFTRLLNTLDIGKIQSFKMKAISPFVDVLRNFNFMGVNGSEMPDIISSDDIVNTKRSILKLISWLCRVYDECLLLNKSKSESNPRLLLSNSKAKSMRNSMRLSSFVSKKKDITMDSISNEKLSIDISRMKLIHSEELLDISPHSIALTIFQPEDTSNSIALAFKIIDLVTKLEHVFIVDLNEYEPLQKTLSDEFGEEKVSKIFNPKSIDWWINYSKYIIEVKLKPFHGFIEKKLIAKYVIRNIHRNKESSISVFDESTSNSIVTNSISDDMNNSTYLDQSRNHSHVHFEGTQQLLHSESLNEILNDADSELQIGSLSLSVGESID